MGKKKKSRDHQVSKGIVGVNKQISKELRRERSGVSDALNKVKAWKELKNPWITINNPSKTQTAKKLIRIKANDLWGDPKKAYMMGASNKEDSDG